MQDTFRCGFVYGLLAALIIGFITGQIRAARTRTGEMNKTLDNFPDAKQPKMTPKGITTKSIFSFFGCFIWTVALIFAIICIYLGIKTFLK